MEVAVSAVPFIPSFPGRSTLGPRDRIVLCAVAEAMFSQDGEVGADRLDTHIDEVDSYISAASKPVRFGLRVALFIVRIAPLLLFFRMRTIDRITVDERVDVLSRLERSRIINLSLAFIGWRAILTMIFYEDPAELRSIGYTAERRVYKRRLPTMPMLAPVAAESGVRLRNPDSDHPSEISESDESGHHKVA
jgi:hypothetical protein